MNDLSLLPFIGVINKTLAWNDLISITSYLWYFRKVCQVSQVTHCKNMLFSETILNLRKLCYLKQNALSQEKVVHIPLILPNPKENPAGRLFTAKGTLRTRSLSKHFQNVSSPGNSLFYRKPKQFVLNQLTFIFSEKREYVLWQVEQVFSSCMFHNRWIMLEGLGACPSSTILIFLIHSMVFNLLKSENIYTFVTQQS